VKPELVSSFSPETLFDSSSSSNPYYINFLSILSLVLYLIKESQNSDNWLIFYNIFLKIISHYFCRQIPTDILKKYHTLYNILENTCQDSVSNSSQSTFHGQSIKETVELNEILPLSSMNWNTINSTVTNIWNRIKDSLVESYVISPLMEQWELVCKHQSLHTKELQSHILTFLLYSGIKDGKKKEIGEILNHIFVISENMEVKRFMILSMNNLRGMIV
jgi:hypothetical protein